MPITTHQSRYPAPESSASHVSTDGGAHSSHSDQETLLSPIGSSMRYTAPLMSPLTGSFNFSSGFNAQSEVATLNVSRIAVQGTSPTHDHLQGIFGKQNKGFSGSGAGLSKGLAQQPLHEETSDMEEDDPVEDDRMQVDKGSMAGVANDDVEMKVPLPNGRVIAIDFDGVYEHYNPISSVDHDAVLENNVRVEKQGMNIPAEVTRKLGDSGPMTEFFDALKALKALGHPLHLVTAQTERWKNAIIAWLTKYGITVGMNEGNIVAGVWCYSGLEQLDQIQEERGAVNGKQEEKLSNVAVSGNKVLRIINASLVIHGQQGDIENCISSDPYIQYLFLGHHLSNVPDYEMSPPEGIIQNTVAGSGTGIKDISVESQPSNQVKQWEDIIRWVRVWDQQATEKA